MLEVIIPGVRHGEAVIATSVAYNGSHCYISGVNSDGYQTLNVPLTTANAMRSLYPIKKYRFEEDLGDTSDAVDKLAKNAMVVYYEGGEYETDQVDFDSLFGKVYTSSAAEYWADVEGTSVSSSNWGRAMYVPGSSTAQATNGLSRLWVSSVGNGKLTASTAWVGAVSTASIQLHGHVGFIVGIHYKDSATAFVRYRVAPGGHTNAI